MGHRKYIFAVIAIIIIAGLSFFYLNETKELRSCNKESNLQVKDQCVSKYAAKRNKVKLCNDLSSNSKGSCLRQVYAKNENLESCKDLQDSYPLDSDICISEIATIKKDISICDSVKFSVAKDSCVKQVIIANNDYQNCSLIKSELQKDFCYIKIAQNTKNINICENIENPNQLKMCFSEYKLVTGEKANCEILKKEDKKIICEDIIN